MNQRNPIRVGLRNCHDLDAVCADSLTRSDLDVSGAVGARGSPTAGSVSEPRHVGVNCVHFNASSRPVSA